MAGTGSKLRLVVATLFVTLEATLLCPTSSLGATFQGLGFLAGDSFSGLTGLSADGSVAVGSSCNSDIVDVCHAFRWTSPTGIVDLGALAPADTYTTAAAVNGDGSVVVGSSCPGPFSLPCHPFRWTAAGMRDLGLVPGDTTAAAYGVSGDGLSVAGYHCNSMTCEAFLWTQTTGLQGLGALPGDHWSIATAVNEDGSVIVGWSCTDATGANCRAFRRTAAGMSDLGVGSSAYATAVSGDGLVVVGYAASSVPGQPSAFRWTSATGSVNIGTNILPSGTNADGSVVAGALFSVPTPGTPNSGAGGGLAGRWTEPTGWQSVQALLTQAGVNLSGWSLGPGSVSADGTVFGGLGADPNGNGQAWVGSLTGGGGCPVTFTPTNTYFGQVQTNLPLLASICQTDPSSGARINPTTPGASTTVTVAQNQTVVLSTFVLGLGTPIPYDPANSRVFVLAQQGTSPVGGTSVAVKMEPGSVGTGGSPLAPATTVLSSVLPNTRTTSPNTPVTAFASMINAGAVTATACSIALPQGVPAVLLYQSTDPQTNMPVGNSNSPVDIPAGQTKTFYFAITPASPFTQDIPLVFRCANTSPAQVIEGVNTFLLTVSATPLADMISIASTITNDGNVVLSGTAGVGAIATAAINLRACQ